MPDSDDSWDKNHINIKYRTDVIAYFGIVFLSLIINSAYLWSLFYHHYNGIEFVLKVIIILFEVIFFISFVCHLVWASSDKHCNDW